MDQKFGVKDLENVVIKAVTPFNFGDRSIAAGEPVLYFDKIQLSQIDQSASVVVARGGKGNQSHVIWEKNNDVMFQLTSGVLTEIGFGLLTNARVLNTGINDTLLVPKTEILALDINGQGTLSYLPSNRKPIFCFIYRNKMIQEKLSYTDLTSKVLSFGVAHAGDNILVEYYFEYGDRTTLYILDKNRFTNYFTLEGKIELRGDTDGLTHTMLVNIPKMKIVSNLNLRLGENASPVVSGFSILSIPQRTPYSDSSVIEFVELEDIIN